MNILKELGYRTLFFIVPVVTVGYFWLGYNLLHTHWFPEFELAFDAAGYVCYGLGVFCLLFYYLGLWEPFEYRKPTNSK